MYKSLPAAFSVICIVYLFSSCASSRRVYYFNDLSPKTLSIDSSITSALQKIQAGDRLSIIMSTKDQQQNELLNPLGLTRGGGGNNTVVGYQVYKEGNIELPVIGMMKVAGLTTEQAADSIRRRLSYFYKDPFVNINLLGRVVVMGTKSPGAVPLYNERLTIFEAIAQSGEIEASARRDRVWVIREQNGERTAAMVNLNSADIFNSPYYFLRTNDLVYVEPGKLNSFLGVNAPGRSLFITLTSITAFILALTK